MGSTVEDYCETCGKVIYDTRDRSKSYTGFCYGHPASESNDDMPVDGEKYVDDLTGVRLTVERGIPYKESSRITAYWSEDGTSTYEEINEAIRRLLKSADF